VAKRIATRQAAAGELADESGVFRRQVADRDSAVRRAQVRTEVAWEFFRAEHGRDPVDAREIAAIIAKQSRPRTQTVAGYDLTFSPVKSVSTLWAVADPHVAAQIELSHQAAVQDALSFIERHALFTRQGRNGIRQVNVRGLVAAVFTHRDSRAGDPDLHTHVAVANKVQTLDGRWLSIDGRVLFKATVAASETYNTALEHHLWDRLGVRFADRPDIDPGKRPVREIVGIDPALNQRWSTRRVLIKNRQGVLAARFQRDHGRPPTPVEALQLAQQATLETPDAKHEPRGLTEQRTVWHAQAAETLGGTHAIQTMITHALHPSSAPRRAVDAEWLTATAVKVLAGVEEHRSTWQSWHVRAEAQRHVRAIQVPIDKVDQLVELLVAEVLQTRSVALTRTEDGITEPGVLRRAGGSSVYSGRIRLVYLAPDFGRRAATRRDRGPHRRPGPRRRNGGVGAAGISREREPLDAGQAALVRAMCTSGARLQLAIAPAGAGKTTAMRTLARAWPDSGGQVHGLAPSPPRPRNSATPQVRRPTRWPSSLGPSTTVTCRIGRNASAGPTW
jgi:conjugative relaxase-like TrwC/TraI family protein